MPDASLLPVLLPVLLPLPITIAILVIDIRRQIIPDRLNLALLGLGVSLAAVSGTRDPAWNVAFALLEAAAAYLLFLGLRAGYRFVRGRTGLGLGDVKFLGAAASLVGLAGVPTLLLVASVSGLAMVAVLAMTGRSIDGETRLPFGPFLVIGLHAAALSGAVGA